MSGFKKNSCTTYFPQYRNFSSESLRDQIKGKCKKNLHKLRSNLKLPLKKVMHYLLRKIHDASTTEEKWIKCLSCNGFYF